MCEGRLDAPFVERTGVPVLQNVLLDGVAEARRFPRGELVLARCTRCDLVTNTAFDAALVDYGEDYENLQICSPAFEQHVDGLVESLVAAGVRDQRVIEVGCGSGYFLRQLCERGENTGVGFDTAYRGPESDGRVRFVRDRYDRRHADVPADVVICRHTIEHVPEPSELLTAVREALGDRSDTLVAFETPDVEWILRNVVFQDFFYEHCSYFAAHSLEHAFRLGAFEPLGVRKVFGDQYLWLEAKPRRPDSAGPATSRLGDLVTRYRAEEQRRLAAARRRLDDFRERGPVAIWGAGAKGVTFLNLLDPDARAIACAVDINPTKQGRYVPGTGHPIVAPGELGERGIATALVMNPNYAEESRAIVRELGFEVTVEAADESERG